MSSAASKLKSPVIRCDSVYKIFGDSAKRMMQECGGVVDAARFQEAGCIVGVNNASFEVHQGELLIVMGLSGSGKSTLLRCISRLTRATAGNIYIEGEDITVMNSKQLIQLRRSKMGMVFQSFALLPHKTVLENIAFPLQVKGVSTKESIQRASEMIDLVSLSASPSFRNLMIDKVRPAIVYIVFPSTLTITTAVNREANDSLDNEDIKTFDFTA